MTKGIERLQRMVAGTHQRSPCGEAMLLPQVSEYRPGYVLCRHTVDARFLNASRVVFGGYLAALLDDVSGHTAMTVLPDEKVCSTSELSVSFFRPCTPQDAELLIEGVLVNQSRRSYHIETTIRRQDQKLIAKSHAVYAVSDSG